MRIELLTVTGCPNSAVIEQRLAEALAGLVDVDLEVERRVVDTVAEAEQYGMHGSPTLLIDGRDPFTAPDTPATVSCRLYRDEDGRAQGAPSLTELLRVLTHHPAALPQLGAVTTGRVS